MFYFLFEQIVIIVFYLHFRNNFSDSIILVIGLLNSSAVELFEGQYFPLVTNILKDLEVEGEKKQCSKISLPQAVSFCLNSCGHLKCISFASISFIVKNLAKRKAKQ